MKREQAVKLVDSGLTTLNAAVAAGRSEEFERYLKVMSRFHRYSFGNVLLILLQCPEARIVAGYHRWKEMGRQVKRGQRGIGILAPMRYRKKDDDEEEEKVSVIKGFKIVHVWDVCQTEGRELPEFAQVTGDPGQRLALIENVVRARGIELCYGPLPPGTLGASSGGKITLREGLSAAEAFSVCAHEAAHEALHYGPRKHDTTKAIRETEAEAVAFVVCHAFGLDSVKRSSDYIQLHRGNPEMLSESLEFIQKTAAELIEQIENADARQAIEPPKASTPELEVQAARETVPHCNHTLHHNDPGSTC